MLHPIEDSLEPVKPAFPELGHLIGPVYKGRKGPELCDVESLPTVLPTLDQSGTLQDRQVLRHGRLRDAGPIGQRPHCLFALKT